MRILLLPDYFWPEIFASSYLFENRNEAFANEGFDMIVYTPSPTRGVDVTMSYQKLEFLYDNHLELHRFKMVGESKSTIQRLARYFLCSVLQFFKALFTRQFDIILLGSTPPFQGAVGAILKIIRNKRFVYGIQDIFPDSLVSTGITKKGSLLWKIGRVIENFTYKHAAKIIVISEDFKKNIVAKGVPEDKIVVIYNWVDQNKVVDVPREENKLFDVYGLDRSKFYITYNGNIGLTQNMDMLLDVAKELQKVYEDIHFVLVGNGAYLDEVKRKVADQQLENVHLLPFQPYEDISHVFSLGDASLVISKPGVGANSVPSKTWSIMSASRPVLANFDENELKTIIENNHCGIFTKAGDKDAFKESILTLYNHRELCKEYGHNGRKFVLDNLTREVGTQKYVDVIKEVCGIKAK